MPMNRVIIHRTTMRPKLEEFLYRIRAWHNGLIDVDHSRFMDRLLLMPSANTQIRITARAAHLMSPATVSSTRRTVPSATP